MAQRHCVVGDEPALEALEVVLQRVADFLIEFVDVVFLQTVAVGWVDDDDASAFGWGEVVHVFLHQVDVVLQVGIINVALGDGYGLRRAVGSPDLVVEITNFFIGFLTDALPQFSIVVVPFHEAPVFAVIARWNLHRVHRRFDGQRP